MEQQLGSLGQSQSKKKKLLLDTSEYFLLCHSSTTNEAT